MQRGCGNSSGSNRKAIHEVNLSDGQRASVTLVGLAARPDGRSSASLPHKLPVLRSVLLALCCPEFALINPPC
jgi:hypothetical protein